MLGVRGELSMFQPEMYKKKIKLENGKFTEYKIFAMGKYKSPLREQILKFKYDGCKYLKNYFAERIDEYVAMNLDTFPLLKEVDYDYLLPVPPRPSSLSKRGYDHMFLLGECLSNFFETPVARYVLESLERLSQIGGSNAARLENVKGAFSLINPSRLEGQSILVLDDVSKSGATLDEVIRTLSTAAPRNLDALILAKTI